MKKRLIAFLLVLIMVLGMLPVSAFAADDGVSPQALNTGHKIDVTFTVLYVGDEFRIGYNYGTSEKTQFVCQYSTPHSDTAYNNHTIAISDIKAAADRATVNSGYQIVGWSKEANANPTVWPLNKSGDTACNKGTTIYLVAKNPNPEVTYTLTYYPQHDGSRHQHAKPQPGDAEEQHQPGDVHRFQRDSCQRRLQLPRLEWEPERNGAHRQSWQFDYNTRRDHQTLRRLAVEHPAHRQARQAHGKRRDRRCCRYCLRYENRNA